jgi:hypothetical protein
MLVEKLTGRLNISALCITANDTLQIRDFFTCTVRLYQLDIVGSIEIAVLFDKGIVQAVQGFPFFVFGLLFRFFWY